MDGRTVNILGIRGLPANHGGFETFVSHLAPYLIDHGWEVVVYCQDPDPRAERRVRGDVWNGIQRVHVPTRTSGSLGTMEFDLRSVVHVLNRPGIDLVLGYNTAVFTALQRLKRRQVVMNMDGIEWKRDKWNAAAKAWFWLNEIVGYGLSSAVIADHPEIERHLSRFYRRDCAVIPYGAEPIVDAPVEDLAPLGLKADDYFVSIARIEPENMILETVEAYSRQRRGRRLVVLGNMDDRIAYHRRVRQAAGPEVVFPGAIYDRTVLRALRSHCRAYIHGHTVGGTNPSLVEAVGAGNAVIAHDNHFNRWTAGTGQLFYATPDVFTAHIETCASDDAKIAAMRRSSRARFEAEFTLPAIHEAYLTLLEEAHARQATAGGVTGARAHRR
ncbi:DUF1972 domain-containing protein [Chthonobacter albigriseus]|uniref:DUF1972 domain-containing protein n=1 Tax=Chthonobacter albigriseus TaxID=1683161 RepID=UPI0015EF995D|nr:DUF1972 domain-containing protein [Chthonobacter albigriseus]